MMPFICTFCRRRVCRKEDENNEGTIGDVTQDGLVNVVDVVLIINIFTKYNFVLDLHIVNLQEMKLLIYLEWYQIS